jgi:hypothetical protein
MNGPSIEHDALIGKIDKWNGEDRSRASSAAETRSEIGDFTEHSGMNPKALSMVRTIKKAALKDGGQAKAMDIIRSLEMALPMVKADISGQQSEMSMDDDEDVPLEHVEDDAPARPSYADDGHLDDDIADESDDFDKALAEVGVQ